MQFASISRRLIPPGSKYPAQYSVFKYPPLMWETKFHTHTKPRDKLYTFQDKYTILQGVGDRPQ
jgi:hypothetical protein